MTLRRTLLLLALTSTAAASACDSAPTGPGTLVATVEGAAVGGVVLEVTGRGVLGFEGLSSTQVYAAPVAGTERFRVMLIRPSSGDLRFEIQVEDVAMEDPVIHVVSAAGLDNSSLLTSGIVVRLERE